MGTTRLSILVALHGGGFSGIDSYAEQISVVAADAGHAVSLVAVGERTSAELRSRMAGTGVGIVPTADLPGGPWRDLVRGLPPAALAELRQLMTAALVKEGRRFDVAHLNHPVLAPAAREFSTRVVAGAWFFPHRPVGRMMETWRHTGRMFPKSAAFAVKGLAHYLNDQAGYRSCDVVAAPTERLATQLRSLRIDAQVFPPPVAPPPEQEGADAVEGPPGALRIMICCADLAHPRKNVRAGIEAAGLLADQGHSLELVLVGGNAGPLAPVIASLPAGVTVRATGRLPRQEIQRYMTASDVLVVPSLYEEWGYVATEALMSGTPVAAFPVYPFDEVLVAPLGAYARDMTPSALAGAIVKAMDAGGDRMDVRDAAIARYGPDEVKRRLESLWSSGRAPSHEHSAANAHVVMS